MLIGLGKDNRSSAASPKLGNESPEYHLFAGKYHLSREECGFGDCGIQDHGESAGPVPSPELLQEPQ
jgi:hypothetical protein